MHALAAFWAGLAIAATLAVAHAGEGDVGRETAPPYSNASVCEVFVDGYDRLASTTHNKTEPVLLELLEYVYTWVTNDCDRCFNPNGPCSWTGLEKALCRQVAAATGKELEAAIKDGDAPPFAVGTYCNYTSSMRV